MIKSKTLFDTSAAIVIHYQKVRWLGHVRIDGTTCPQIANSIPAPATTDTTVICQEEDRINVVPDSQFSNGD